MAAIHEDDIKHIALGFLRTLYKHRPRSSAMETAVDMRGEGDIIVDSYLSFLDDKGNRFVATAEATSLDTREEVKYSVQYQLLLWDSIVFGVIAAIVFFVVTSGIEKWSMPSLTPLMRGILTVGSIVLFTVLYHARIRPLRRYRYIYAIAQFKKYHVSEQWVALARDVFPRLDRDPYYRELKRQCVRFGFGLILVERDHRPRLIVSPSREEIFDRKRRKIKLLSLDRFKGFQRMARQEWLLVKWWRAWWNPYKQHDYLRFRSGFYHQFALIGMGLLILLGLFIREKGRMPIRYANEKRYERQMSEQAQQLDRELADQDPAPVIIPLDADPDDDGVLREEVVIDSILPIEPEAEVLIYDPYNQVVVLYDCERLYNFTDTKYLVVIGQYGDWITAKEELEILGDAGLPANAFWEGCFSPTREAYVLYADPMHNTELEAREAMRQLAVTLREVKVKASIRPLTPVNGIRFQQ